MQTCIFLHKPVGNELRARARVRNLVPRDFEADARRGVVDRVLDSCELCYSVCAMMIHLPVLERFAKSANSGGTACAICGEAFSTAEIAISRVFRVLVSSGLANTHSVEVDPISNETLGASRRKFRYGYSLSLSRRRARARARSAKETRILRESCAIRRSHFGRFGDGARSPSSACEIRAKPSFNPPHIRRARARARRFCGSAILELRNARILAGAKSHWG